MKCKICKSNQASKTDFWIPLRQECGDGYYLLGIKIGSTLPLDICKNCYLKHIRDIIDARLNGNSAKEYADNLFLCATDKGKPICSTD